MTWKAGVWMHLSHWHHHHFWVCSQVHMWTAGKSCLCQKTFVTRTRLKHTSVMPKPGHSVLRTVQLTCSKSGGIHWSALSSLIVNLAVRLAIDCCFDVQELTDARLPFACHDGHWRQSQRYPVWLQGTILPLHHCRLQHVKLVSPHVYLHHPHCVETVQCIWDDCIGPTW